MPSCKSIGFIALLAISLAEGQGQGQTQKIAQQYRGTEPEIPGCVQRDPTLSRWTNAEPGPVSNLAVFAREKSGGIWLGGKEGAARFDPSAKHPWDRWQYFHGRRWLQDDDVKNICLDESSSVRRVWIRTALGVSRLEWRPMHLAEKARFFEERIEARHVRHGLVADTSLPVAGDLTQSRQYDSDNDGLWTAMYLAAESYRFAVTRAPEARARAQRAFEALQRLEEITGIPGFPARSILSKNERAPHGGEWHDTPDGQWRWKGDTSSDELVGHYFGHSLYYDLVANPADRKLAQGVIARMTDHLMAHDYDLIDLDGQPTRWGQWSERYFQTEEGRYEAPLRSLELLSFLRTARHITGDAKYDAAYQDRIAHGYAAHLQRYRRWDGGGEINFSDDELAYLSYAPLLQHEHNRKFRQAPLDSLRFTWSQKRADRNPLWNFISVASGASPMTPEVLEESRRTLERIPMDMVGWTVTNSHRRDVRFRPEKDRFGHAQLTDVLAPDERPVERWNSNPYVPDGGSGGHQEDDGVAFLLPYWMARYHGWIRD